MEIDSDYLQHHFASLSDDALKATDRGELVETAQKLYDDELARRKIAPTTREVEDEQPGAQEKPEWYEDAVEVFFSPALPGQVPAPEIKNAHDALVAAGIPAYVDVAKIPEDKGFAPRQTHYMRVVVPGNLNLHAASVLDRDIFNPEFEETWKNHLAVLSDEKVRAMRPEVVFCGLFDQVERVQRVYSEEMARRGLE